MAKSASTKKRASPDEKRARELVDSLENGDGDPQLVFEAFAELDVLPPEVVRAAMGDWIGAEHAAPRPVLRLATMTSVRDADVLDEGPVAEAQLRAAGKFWDGADLEPEERLDGELEGTFAGTLERRVLGEGEAARVDAILFHEDAGVFFRAGTTQIVGARVDGRFEVRDAELRAALEEALAPAEPEPARAAPKKRASRAKKKSAP
jgi:hypothetical protein